MKKYVYTSIILSAFLILTCRKTPDRDSIDKKYTQVEQYTFDSDGVVFKIINDIDSFKSCQYDSKHKIDSLLFGKFQHNSIPSNDSLDVYSDIRYFTCLKINQYVSWRYKYIDDSIKHIRVVLYLNYPQTCSYSTTLLFDSITASTSWFQSMFPYPVNDTIEVKVSNIFKISFPDSF